MMFRNSALVGVFVMSVAVSVFAQEPGMPAAQPEHESAVVFEEVVVPDRQEEPCSMRHMGMMQKGMGKHGKGHDGMKHSKGKHGKHAEVLRRLDMIEARMARMEAMLEALMRR
jgi:hypothetical protein